MLWNGGLVVQLKHVHHATTLSRFRMTDFSIGDVCLISPKESLRATVTRVYCI